MARNVTLRSGMLVFIYVYTIIGAGGFGLGIIVAPDYIGSVFGVPKQEPMILGVVGSVFLSFGLLSILGLRSPRKFLPVVLLQLCYKVIWFGGVVFPLLIRGQFPEYGIIIALIFAVYVIGDLFAIPFPYIFSKYEG